MPNNLTDNEIKKALGRLSCKTLNDCKLINDVLDLINRKEQENKSLKAEVERLKNAYKQCAWERDIFAEDMTQEIKKDCSYLMLDIKTIKAEAYKECIKKVKEKSCKMNMLNNNIVVKTDYQISGESLDNLLNELL